jgi:hypothetical protein
MTKYRDITGQRFGRLVAVRLSFRKNYVAHWLCKCDCGNETTAILGDLSMGKTKSCGCLHHFVCKTKSVTHGMSRTRLNIIWRNMKTRCENKNDKFYHRYGARGICVCYDWHSFQSFMKWATSSGYEKNLTIDRINNDGNYEPNNCRWATWIEQANNMSRNHFLTFNGETMTLMEWHRRTGINYSTIRSRVGKGWSTERVLS